jgi:hypothetical protein
MVVQPMLASGAGRFERPAVEYGSSRLLSTMQSSAELEQALGVEPNYVAYGRGTEAAGAVAAGPLISVGSGTERIRNAEGIGDVLLGSGEIALGVLPAGLAVRSEVALLRAERNAARAMQQSKPVIVTESASSWGKSPQFLKTEANWTAPSSGTGQTYKVYQQEIDWTLVVRERTNLERARAGEAPFVLRNGEPQQINLHHSRQDARGPLFELSEGTHIRTKSGHGREAVHPYGRRQHPDYPVNRPIFDKDRRQYWQDRVEGIE